MDELLKQWQALMNCWSPKGWDGVAEVVVNHVRKICALEKQMDAIDPSWRDKDLGAYNFPQTCDPRPITA